MIFEAEFREDIGKAIPCIVECLNNPDCDARIAATNGLSSLGTYCMCPSVSPLLES